MEPIWTKETVEKEIRSQKRSCRGKCILPTEAQKDINNTWLGILSKRIWTEALLFQGSLEIILKQGHLEIPNEDWEMMNRHIRGLWDLRQGCGYDINNVILSQPLDGEIHSFTCPRCGIQAKFIPGVFEGVHSLAA